MARSLIALLSAVAAVGVLTAGPLEAAAPGGALPTEDVAGQQVARLLLVDTMDEGDQRWDTERLGAFVEQLETHRTQALDVEVVDDRTGPALEVTVDALGGDVDEVCVVAAEDGRPASADRPCETG